MCVPPSQMEPIALTVILRYQLEIKSNHWLILGLQLLCMWCPWTVLLLLLP